MVSQFIVAFALLANCPETNVINHTDVWKYNDATQLEYSAKRCKDIYPNSPCLKTFIKQEERVYHAICGGENT